MKKQSLVIIGANLAIVALLAVTATLLVNKGKTAEPQTDTRSQASSNKGKNTVATPASDVLDTSLVENDKDLNSIVSSDQSTVDQDFPALNSADFE